MALMLRALAFSLFLVLLSASTAHAVEVFGVRLFGAEPVVDGIPYSVSIALESDEADLSAVVSEASLLIEQQKTGAPDRAALIARARADTERLAAALQSEGRFGARIDIEIDGASLDDALAAMTDTAEDSTAAEIRIAITPGPAFRLGDMSFTQTVPTAVEPPMTPQAYGLVAGEPARPAAIAAAIDRIIEAWRTAGYPFASVAHREITADHATAEVHITLVVAPGDEAVYGWINVVGSHELSSAKVADYSAIEPGRRFNPSDLRKSRERLRKLESIESVRIIEGEEIGADGGIPITLEISERKPRYLGGTASVSTLDGGELNAYWGHRNLFGEGERLRVDATVSNIGVDSFDRLQFSTGATYAKPGFLDIDTDLFAEFRLEREAPDTYDSYAGFLKLGVAHRFNADLDGSVAVSARQTRIEDAFGTRSFSLLSLPAELVYDTRDNRMDASQGLHSISRVTPVFDIASGNAYVASSSHLASYVAFDDERRAILAGRIGIESVAGASLADVPATDRVFAGGGGSVRGYEYRSLGPTQAGQVTGGMSLLSASLELRLRVTPAIGIVPFVDVATVSDESFPTFSEATYVGAGIGLRYFTALGPLRVDVAMPLTEKDGRDNFGIYVGLGQAF